MFGAANHFTWWNVFLPRLQWMAFYHLCPNLRPHNFFFLKKKLVSSQRKKKKQPENFINGTMKIILARNPFSFSPKNCTAQTCPHITKIWVQLTFVLGWCREIMHAMWKPQKFKLIYLMATLYVLTLTLPSAISVYWAFGDMLLNHSNAFSLLPRSGFRDMAVILMLIHQVRDPKHNSQYPADLRIVASWHVKI